MPINLLKTSEALKQFHLRHPLSGDKNNELLEIGDELLFYLLALLRKDVPVLPKVGLDQWKKLVGFLGPHGLIPLLFYEISFLPLELQPPKEIIDSMRLIFLKNRMKQLNVDKQMKEILKAFEQNDIQVLALKGVALARRIYKDPALRPTGDIDLLVEPEKVIKARDILAKIGYKPGTRMYECFSYLYTDEQYYYFGKKHNYDMVELHWDIHPYSWIRMRGELPKVLARAITVEKERLVFKTLNPVDDLVYLAIHQMFTHNQDVRLIWLYDIAILAQQLSLPEGEEAIKKSRAWQGELGLKRCLELGALWFGIKAPDWARELQPSKTEVKLYVSSGYLRNPLRNIGSPVLNFREKVGLLFHVIFPPPYYMRTRYAPASGWQLPFSYMRRWWKLSGNIVKK
ncbi:MAG: nucleotidyltransferase family protein [bacterium]